MRVRRPFHFENLGKSWSSDSASLTANWRIFGRRMNENSLAIGRRRDSHFKRFIDRSSSFSLAQMFHLKSVEMFQMFPSLAMGQHSNRAMASWFANECTADRWGTGPSDGGSAPFGPRREVRRWATEGEANGKYQKKKKRRRRKRNQRCLLVRHPSQSAACSVEYIFFFFRKKKYFLKKKRIREAFVGASKQLCVISDANIALK